MECFYFLIDTLLHSLGLSYFFSRSVDSGNLIFIFLSAISEYKLGLITHEGCHRAIPFYYGYIYDLCLSSKEYWMMKHNKGHHQHVNSTLDPDVNLEPFLRIRIDQPYKWYHAYQHIYQYLLFALSAFSLRINGILYVWQTGSSIFFHSLCHFCSFLFFVGWPVYKWGIFKGISFYILHNIIIGLLYGIIFSVSHFNQHSRFENDKNFVDTQYSETADWSSGSYFWNYATGGLNHQVIHHLHPNISSYNYPRMANSTKHPQYKKFKNLWEAIKSNYNFMKQLAKEQI